MKTTLSSIYAFLALALSAGSALAETTTHIDPKAYRFQEAVTPVMERLTHLHDNVTVVMMIITLFVLALLTYVCVRFSAKSNPTPSKTTHNTTIEIIWTAIPILILVAIAFPSLRLHYYMDEAPKADLTLKVEGYQWYWVYSYPDNGGFKFESRMVEDADLKNYPNAHRLLTTDVPVYVPVNKVVRVQVTGADVIHSWAMPAFGVKTDAIPGRLNETWFKATKEGVYYGQCSELCGVNHGFMPIEIHVVSQEKFDAWVAESQKKFSANDNTPVTLAQNTTR